MYKVLSVLIYTFYTFLYICVFVICENHWLVRFYTSEVVGQQPEHLDISWSYGSF